MGKLEKVVEKFRQQFGGDPIVVRSPGRINLIGEHTDYNLGYVLPGAIDKNIYVAIGSRKDDNINVFAADYNDPYSTSLNDIKQAWKLWPNYPLGVINELQKMGLPLRGMDIVLGGDIPLGAGLSSSAATTCAVLFAINNLFNLNLKKIEMAKIAQMAEHTFVGVQCGLMDPFASLFGKQNHLIKLNCKNNDYEYIQFKPEHIKIVLFDSRVKHHLVSSAYNLRRQECQRGLELIKEQVPIVDDLSDVDEDMLMKVIKPISEIYYNRCLYVVQENRRLQLACAAIENNDFETVGNLMYKTHEGLKSLYEVSCAECDSLIDAVKMSPYVLGARMMGGGFGGCTINLIHEDFVDSVVNSVKVHYEEKFAKELKVYDIALSEGTQLELVSI